MINGVVPSQIATLLLHQKSLKRKIRARTLHNNSDLSLDTGFIHLIRQKQENHVYYHQQRAKGKPITISRRKLNEANNTIYKRIISIRETKSQYTYNPRESFFRTMKPSSYVDRKKREEEIGIRNPQIAKRIINKRGHIDHLKDLADYCKTRMIVKRLERFNQVTKMMGQHSPNNSPNSKGSFTSKNFSSFSGKNLEESKTVRDEKGPKNPREYLREKKNTKRLFQLRTGLPNPNHQKVIEQLKAVSEKKEQVND